MNHHLKNTVNAALSASLWLSIVAAAACGDALDLDSLRTEAQEKEAALSAQVTRSVLSGASVADAPSADEGATLTLGGGDSSSVISVSDAEDASSVISVSDAEDASSVITTSGGGSASVSITAGGGGSRPVILTGPPDAGAAALVLPPTNVGSANSRVRVVATNGSGCAGQEATVSAVADDLSSFSISFGGYTAVLGDDLALQRRNCIFAIEIDPPPGMTYAVTAVPMSGQANLNDGATGRIATQYFYQGVSQTSGTGADIPTTIGGWTTDGAFAADQVQSAPCGVERALIVNTSALVNGEAGDLPSSVTVDPVVDVELSLSACP